MHHVGSPKAYMALYLVQSSVLLFITAAAVSEEKPASCIKCWLLIQKLTFKEENNVTVAGCSAWWQNCVAFVQLG